MSQHLRVNKHIVDHWNPNASRTLPTFEKYSDFLNALHLDSIYSFFNWLTEMNKEAPGTLSLECTPPPKGESRYLAHLDRHPQLAFLFLFFFSEGVHRKLTPVQLQRLANPYHPESKKVPRFSEIYHAVLVNRGPEAEKLMAAKAAADNLYHIDVFSLSREELIAFLNKEQNAMILDAHITNMMTVGSLEERKQVMEEVTLWAEFVAACEMEEK